MQLFCCACSQDLLTRRTWDVNQHPLWLVFEAEGQLQIRPKQYFVAKQLLENPTAGPIIQLNMGEGKTRVILPMLVLSWATGDKLVCFIPSAARSLMQWFTMGAAQFPVGSLGRSIQLPSSILNSKCAAAEAVQNAIQQRCSGDRGRAASHAQHFGDVLQDFVPAALTALRLKNDFLFAQEGGMLVTTPESRLSMFLKAQELWKAGGRETEVKLLDLITQAPCCDILDESDQLLHNRFQLIYAAGDCTGLPAGLERQHAVQAVLRVLSKYAHTSSNQIGAALAVDGVSAWEKPKAQYQRWPSINVGPVLPRSLAFSLDGCSFFLHHGCTHTFHSYPGSFCGLRLLPGNVTLQQVPHLHQALWDQMTHEPPYEMRWLQTTGRQ
eukprot:scaffold174391_cov33-Prasinocladus_malaysianus.AAC.2